MIDIFLLYCWTRLDSIIFLGVFITISAFVLSFVYMVAGNSSYTSKAEEDAFHEVKRRWFYIGIVVLVFSVLIPTKTDVAVIVGGKLTIDAIKSPTAQEVGSEVKRIIMNELKGYKNEKK